MVFDLKPQWIVTKYEGKDLFFPFCSLPSYWLVAFLHSFFFRTWDQWTFFTPQIWPEENISYFQTLSLATGFINILILHKYSLDCLVMLQFAVTLFILNILEWNYAHKIFMLFHATKVYSMNLLTHFSAYIVLFFYEVLPPLPCFHDVIIYSVFSQYFEMWLSTLNYKAVRIVVIGVTVFLPL